MDSTVSLLRRKSVVAALLAILAIAVYAGSFSDEFLNFDDLTYVAGNPELRKPFPEAVGTIFSSFYFSNYNPLQRLTYLVEWKLFGADALPYRVTNLALHVLAAFLLFLVLREWLGDERPAVVGALLFVLHPMNVENVAWISERKTLIATAAAFAALYFYLRGAKGMRGGTAYALLLFVVGLFGKASIVVLPVLLFLMDLSIRRRPSLTRYALFLVPAVLFSVVQVMAANANDAIVPFHGGSLPAHVMTGIAAFARYVGGTLVPIGQAPLHSFEPVLTAGDPRFLAGVAVLALFAFFAYRSFKGERRFLVGLVWFPVVLLPTLAVPIPIIYAERYLYLAAPLLVAAGVAWALEQEGNLKVPLRTALAGAVALLFLATLSYASYWKSPTTLWVRSVGTDPNVAEAWTLLGGARLKAGDPDSAVTAFRESLKIEPGEVEVESNLAFALFMAGDLAGAEKTARGVLQSEPERGRAWAIVGGARDLGGDEAGAVKAYEEGLRACSEDADLLKNYASFHIRHGRLSEGAEGLRRVVELAPRDREAWKLLAEVLKRQDLVAEAARCEAKVRELRR